jgi:hypothetical protein
LIIAWISEDVHEEPHQRRVAHRNGRAALLVGGQDRQPAVHDDHPLEELLQRPHQPAVARQLPDVLLRRLAEAPRVLIKAPHRHPATQPVQRQRERGDQELLRLSAARVRGQDLPLGGPDRQLAEIADRLHAVQIPDRLVPHAARRDVLRRQPSDIALQRRGAQLQLPGAPPPVAGQLQLDPARIDRPQQLAVLGQLQQPEVRELLQAGQL